jgi:hypothetical protein
MQAKLMLFVLMSAAAQSAAISYHVIANTAPYAGMSGSLEFTLSSSGLPPAVTAAVAGPGLPAVTLNNAALFDLATVPFTFGNTLGFDVTLNVGPYTPPLSEGTTFGFGLKNSSGAYLGGAGPLLSIDLTPEGFVVTADQSVSVAAVPEPSAVFLVACGLFAIIARRGESALTG